MPVRVASKDEFNMAAAHFPLSAVALQAPYWMIVKGQSDCGKRRWAALCRPNIAALANR